MEPFVSSFQNKIDKKGRVSVPASFRSILAKDSASGVVQIFSYPAIDAAAIECGGASLLNKVYQLIEDLPPYSDERDEMSTALFGGSTQLKIDSDGRIILPDDLREQANLTDFATFVGMGDKFRIWSPKLFETYMREARAKAIEHRKLFGLKHDRK